MAQTAAQENSNAVPLRVGVVGLVHGHVEGFFQHNLHRSDIQIVGIADSNQPVFARYAKQFSLDSKLYYSSLEEMLQKTRPQAVLVYTSTYDHRAVVDKPQSVERDAVLHGVTFACDNRFRSNEQWFELA